MNANSYIHTAWNTPFIPQRADPYVLHHGNEWYFTASVPEYDRIVLRHATSLEGLAYSAGAGSVACAPCRRNELPCMGA